MITAVGVGIVAASLILVQRLTNLQLEQVRLITEPGDEAPFSEEEA